MTTTFGQLTTRPIDGSLGCLQSSIQCVGLFCFCIHFVKIVSFYDLSVLSMSVMGFKKIVWMGFELYRGLYFWNFVHFAKPLTDA